MTSLLPPTSEPGADEDDGGATDGRPTESRPRPAAIGALLAVGWTAPTGALLCAGTAVASWLLGGQADAEDAPAAARLGANAWLLTHHTSIRFDEGTFGLAPLGLCAVLAVICFLAGGWITRTSDLDRTLDVAVGIGGYTLCYGGFAALVAMLARTGAIEVSPVAAFGNAGLLAGAAATAGVLTERGDLARWVASTPPRLRTTVRAAAYGVAALLGAGTLVLLLALAANGGRIAEFGTALRPGFSGWLVLILLCLVFLPNAALYAVSYLLGPGFALGVGTVVSPTTVVLGPLPTFPLLAAVPGDGASASWLLVVLLVPVAAGAFAGSVVHRRHPNLAPRWALFYGGAAGALMALTVSGLVTLAGGSAGPGRMAEFGAATAWVMLTALLLCTAGSAGAAAAVPLWRRWWGSRRLAPAGAADRADDEDTADVEPTAAADQPATGPTSDAPADQQADHERAAPVDEQSDDGTDDGGPDDGRDHG